jgi:hypothetical protein
MERLLVARLVVRLVVRLATRLAVPAFLRVGIKFTPFRKINSLS